MKEKIIDLKLLPFLKWPGGKRWLNSKYLHFSPPKKGQYFEPFLGGGAVFFSLQPQFAILSDINSELINLYQIMRDNCSELVQAMHAHQKFHNKEYYYMIRSARYDDPIKSASRFLYLNRMCYNGMYRVNKSGQFNVPIGTKTNCIFDINLFPAYSNLLKKAEILKSDFEPIINKTEENDFIFADPPYSTSHNQNSFIKYNEILFTWKDQLRLIDALSSAKSRGVHILSTNADFDLIKEMYKDRGFHIKVLERFSVISSKIDRRRKQSELLISSYPIDI